MRCFLLCFTQAFEERPWFVSVRHHFRVRENMPLETIKGLQRNIRVKNRLQCVFRMLFFFFLKEINYRDRLQFSDD